MFVTEIAQFRNSGFGGLPNGLKVDVAIFMRDNISHTSDGTPGDTGMRTDKLRRKMLYKLTNLHQTECNCVALGRIGTKGVIVMCILSMRKHDVIAVALNFLEDLRVTTLCGHIKQFPPRQSDPETVDPSCPLSANLNLFQDYLKDRYKAHPKRTGREENPCRHGDRYRCFS